MFSSKLSLSKRAQLRGLVVGVALALLLVGTAHAQPADPPRLQHTDPVWQVAYWNNTTLSGNPVLQTTEQDLNHDWGTGGPGNGVHADGFSARWTRYIDVSAAGTYRFTATSDDGIRVIVDGVPVIDQWDDHAASTFSGDVHLTAGHHQVVVEYYENRGYAVASVTWWGPVSTTPYGWRGEYFANRSLSGTPRLVRDDPVTGSGGLSLSLIHI